MKRFLPITLIFCLAFCNAFSQKIGKLYATFGKQDYVKCVEQCNSLLKKNPDMIEAYYVKSIAYFEMAQSPSDYKEFARNPLLECLNNLSILSSKDSDKEILDEHTDTLQIIKEFAENRAKRVKVGNPTEAQAITQRLNSIFRLKSDALEFARVDIINGNYDKCYSKIDRLYSKSPAEISSGADNYEALVEGAVLLAENWMFSDLFTLIRNYKTKFAGNYGISQSFKKALIISIDTARTDDDKTLFLSFSKTGLELYPEDKNIYNHIQKRWVEIINAQSTAFNATQSKERTWKDSVYLRNAYRYLALAKEVFPTDKKFDEITAKLNADYHTVPFSYEQANFRRFATEAVNRWRAQGCECDTGNVVKVYPVPPLEWDTLVERLANEHAREMFFENHSEDVNVRGETPWDRMNKTTYKGTTYETEEGLNFVQAMKMAFSVGYGISLDNANSPEEMQATIDTLVYEWIEGRMSKLNCLKLMTPDVTHFAIGVYGDKWVFWAITKYDILIQKKRK